MKRKRHKQRRHRVSTQPKMRVGDRVWVVMSDGCFDDPPYVGVARMTVLITDQTGKIDSVQADTGEGVYVSPEQCHRTLDGARAWWRGEVDRMIEEARRFQADPRAQGADGFTQVDADEWLKRCLRLLDVPAVVDPAARPNSYAINYDRLAELIAGGP